jgi:hypothetical protein
VSNRDWIGDEPDVRQGWEALVGFLRETGAVERQQRIEAIGSKLDEGDREELAQSILELIAAPPWPHSWVGPREALVQAASLLADALSRARHESPANATNLAWLSVQFFVAQRLLLLPCPPAELRLVAVLCNAASAVAAETILAARATPDSTELLVHVATSLFQFGEAGKAMNLACEERLFEPPA